MRHPFLRTLAGSAATPTDPNFENVTLLLHGDGTNGGQNNTFVDGSTNNFTITRNGNTTQGTFSPYGDNWSNYFDGTGDYLVTPTNAALSVGTGDFTCETFVYFNALEANNHGIVSQLSNGDGSNHSIVFLTAGSTVYLRVQNLIAVAFEGTATVTIGQWYHFALVRSGTNIAAFVNGSRINSGTNSTNIVKQIFTVGRLYSGNDQEYSKAYISNFRLVKGSAVYDPTQTTLTVPASPLTAITNTSLLTCQSNRFRDASTNNFTITRNGDVSVQRFSPFSPTAAYAAGTIGGSGYFDGTDDWLSAASDAAFNLGTGNFTIECWAYFNAAQGDVNIVDATATNGIFLKTEATIVAIGRSGTAIDTSFTYSFTRGQWYHIAFSRSGSTVYGFVNGVLLGSNTNTNNYVQAGLRVGADSVGGRDFNGYLSDLRLLKGTAQYTATFTPPAAPLTAITNTSLLLNFTNAAILDNAMMAVPETVGNAQIDTTTKKFGTGSLEFDGTGDYLSIPPTSEFEFGTGDFTVECWFYASTVSGGEIPIYKQHAASNGICEIRISSSKIYGKTVTDQTVGAGTTTLSTNTWYHVAFVKSSNVYTLYLNGVSEGGTVTNSTGIVRPTTVRVGSNQTAGVFFTGFIDDLRVTKGVARYTANFTAPTAAFPDL